MSQAGPKKVIVVGAGVGGIATAARLAHAGLDVEVYEKNEFSGGRCSLIHHEGHRFDQGPSLFLLPPLFHQLYNELGHALEDHIELVQCDPNYVIHYHDGESVTLSSNRAALAREIERFEGREGVEGLEGFLKEAGIHGALSYDLVLSKTFPTLLSLLRPSFIWNVIKLHPFGTLYGRTARYFRTERLRRAFSFGSMYLGSSPFESPGTYSLLQWTETCEGIHYPLGGFHRVPQTLIQIAESQPHPAKFHYNQAVERVTYNASGRATGIVLENGEVKTSDAVVVNADLVWAHNHLFKKDGAAAGGLGEMEEKEERVKAERLDPRLAERLLNKPHSCSSISFYWAMDSIIPSLNAHNIFLAEDYKGSFDDIFKDRSMPREPSFYVNVPSRIDPSAAPPNKDTIVVLVPVGHLLPDAESLNTPGRGNADLDDKHPSQDWDELVERARGQVIATMEKRLEISDLRGKISWEGVNTPLTWKEKFNLTHGSILGITHDFFNVLSFRHQARHPRIAQAYFVGASAHPGTGVPIAIAGSKLCAEAVFKDLGVAIPDTYSEIGSVKPGKGLELDVKKRKSLVYWLEGLVDANVKYVVGGLVGVAVMIAMGVLQPAGGAARVGLFGAGGEPPQTQLEELGSWVGGLVGKVPIRALPVEVIPWFALAFIAFFAPMLAKRVISV